MPKIVVGAFMSLDGVVQAPGGPDEDRDGGFAHGGWSMPYFDPEVMGPAWGGAMAGASGMLLGRRTWEVSAGAWPERAGDPFADQINALPKYVASRTLGEEDLKIWSESRLLPVDDAIGGIRSLREEDGAPLLVMGSPSLARQLTAHDLVDEYLVMIEPVVLGGGKGLFGDDGGKRGLELVSSVTASTGVLVCTYRRVRD